LKAKSAQARPLKVTLNFKIRFYIMQGRMLQDAKDLAKISTHDLTLGHTSQGKEVREELSTPR